MSADRHAFFDNYSPCGYNGENGSAFWRNMQEKGVSQLVSVDLKKAEQLVA